MADPHNLLISNIVVPDRVYSNFYVRPIMYTLLTISIDGLIGLRSLICIALLTDTATTITFNSLYSSNLGEELDGPRSVRSACDRGS
jgi:hypothetical protein